jgi:hypothetical protein
MNDAETLRRLVLGLHSGAVELGALQTAAGLARALSLELHAVFLEDAASVGAALLPFTRELRLPTHDWQDTDAVRLRQELAAAAAHAGSELARVGANSGIVARFEVRHGDPVPTTIALCGRHDVVAIHDSDAAFEGLTRTGARLRRAAQAAGANFLLLPRRLGNGAGPIVAVTTDAAVDPALTLARRMAATAGRELVVLESANSGWLAAPALGRGSCLIVGRGLQLPEPAMERVARMLALPILVIGERPPGRG